MPIGGKDETYGQAVESILKSTMQLEQVRNEDISEKLDRIYK